MQPDAEILHSITKEKCGYFPAPKLYELSKMFN